jgi:hypothetical protein
MAELFSQIFVNLPPVTDCENLTQPLFSVDLVDDAKSAQCLTCINCDMPLRLRHQLSHNNLENLS